jgi:phosphotransferase system HPr (HPr) family protein
MPTAVREIVIKNAQGLHARPAMVFADMANRFRSTVTVRKNGPEPVVADGKSTMQMILLAAPVGTALVIETAGEDAEQAATELAELVDSKFGENG